MNTNWGEKYQIILTRISVDDVRLGTTFLTFRMRFDVTEMQFVWSVGAEEEDKKLKKIENESATRGWQGYVAQQ